MFTLSQWKKAKNHLRQDLDRAIKGNEIHENNSLKPVSWTTEWIVSRVMKIMFGVGQKDIEDIVDQIAIIVANNLSASEIIKFQSIASENWLSWNGTTGNFLKKSLLKREKKIPLLWVLLNNFYYTPTSK